MQKEIEEVKAKKLAMNQPKKVRMEEQAKKKIDDFGDMTSILESLEQKAIKTQKHNDRIRQQDVARKNKQDRVDAEKERLNKIGSLPAFQDSSALDTLFNHISNQIKN